MSSRVIIDSNKSLKCIEKHIDFRGYPLKFSNIIFPKIEEFQNNPACLLRTLEEFDDLLRQAIIQQYNEILIYQAAPLEYKNLLAPQLKIDYNYQNNIPIITYPKMRPLLTEQQALKYDSTMASLYVGWQCCNNGVSFFKMKKFFNALPALCDYFGLVEEDIIENYENIGYDRDLGFRILDYGLCDDEVFIG